MTTSTTTSATAAEMEEITTTTSEPQAFLQSQITTTSQPQVSSQPLLTTTTSPPPLGILTSNDGTFRLDLTSFNLSPQDLATITAAFNATINSSTTTISAATSPSSITTSSNNVSTSFNTSPATPMTSSSTSMLATPSSEFVMKQTPKTRRQRAKHSIVPEENLILPENVPGTFLNLTQTEFDEMVNDNESALAFAARVGLIQNVRKCPKCERDMALCKFNNSCGYRWVCRRTENSKRFTCSVRGMRKETILDDRLVGILTMLRIMYHFSKNVSDSEIISRLDIGHVRSARTIFSRLRDMVDEEVLKLSADSLLSAEELRQHFLVSEGIDHFGFVLFWGTRYKAEKSSTESEEKSSATSDEKPPCNNNDVTENSNISEVPIIEEVEDLKAESVDVNQEEEVATQPTSASENVIKYETESEAESSVTCSTAREETEEDLKESNNVFYNQDLMLSESSSSSDSNDSDSD